MAFRLVAASIGGSREDEFFLSFMDVYSFNKGRLANASFLDNPEPAARRPDRMHAGPFWIMTVGSAPADLVQR